MRYPLELDPAFSLDRPAPVGAVLAAITTSSARHPHPPPWLTSKQVEPFKRTVDAVTRFGGALLMLPVGSGKTYVSLAAATTVLPNPPTAVVPAVLVSQWRRVAQSLGIELGIVSHEGVSRGAIPGGSGVVIIDESHRFREPTTRRYRTLAPALVGRPVILATATPIVNRPADLAAQLLLAVPDDALAWSGIPSLRAYAASPIGSLDHVVIRSTTSDPMPARTEQRILTATDPVFDQIQTAIDRLGCARKGSVAGLIRHSLYRALGSSPAALLEALDRYHRLLAHAAEAARAGHSINRRAIYDVVGHSPDQLVLWDLLDHRPDSADLRISDRRLVVLLRRKVAAWLERGDQKLEQLRPILLDRRPTIVFAGAIETVRYLRLRLGLSGTAWITGSGAGIGANRASRQVVLEVFRTAASPVPKPWLLIASDVAAEGLNLQGASRVVHYDLPWTAVRLDQRDGRAIRMGSTNQSVEVVRFEPPPPLEQRLALVATISRKATLPTILGPHRPGLGPTTEAAVPGWAAVRGECPAQLAAVSLGTASRLVLARVGDAAWTADSSVVDGLVERARKAVPSPCPVDLTPILTSLARAVGDHLSTVALGSTARNAAAVRALATRGAELRRSRRRDELALVGAVHRLLGRGHSAGEQAVVRRMTSDPVAFHQAVLLGQATPPSQWPTPTLLALVVFEPEGD